MKRWAYYKDEKEDYQEISAYQVAQKKKAEPGIWEGRTFYSTHYPPEIRLEMCHKCSERGNYFFAYNPGQEDALNKLGGEGESLTHKLIKTAICELSQMSLVIIGENTRFYLNFLKGETEKEVKYNDKKYYIDVFKYFTSRHCDNYKKNLELKWEGKIGIEVRRTNKVKNLKQAALKAGEIPTVEFHVPENWEFDVYMDVLEKNSTEKDWRNYIERIKKNLSIYMKVTKLNDPSSKEYLAEENQDLKKQMFYAKESTHKLMEKNKVLERIVNEKECELSTKTSIIERLTANNNNLERELTRFMKMRFFRWVWFRMTGR